MRKTTNKILSALIAASLVFGMVTTASAASEGDTEPTAETVQETVETPAEDQQEPAAEETVTEEPAAEDSEEQKEEAPAAAEEEKAEEQKEEAPAEEAPAEEIAPAEEAAPAEEVAPAEEEAVETVSEPEEETAAAMPAQTFSKTVKEKVKGKKKTVVKVEVSAPEGAFPEGTEMTVTKVGENDRVGGRKRGKTYRQAIESVARSDVKTIMAVDITFTKDGKEIEPAKDISVSFKSDSLAAKEGQTLSIVHIADDGSAEVIKDAKINENKQEATFDAGDFSVYAVLGEEETGDNARLFVTFKQAGGGEDIVIPVKKTDIKTETIDGVEVNHFEQVLYDPGVGSLDDGQMFKGWTTIENYTDETEALTIDDVRDAVKKLLNDGVTEGQKITYYPMIFSVRYVSYFDELGSTIRVDSVIFKAGESKTYTIDEPYSPYTSEAKFVGWAEAEQDSETGKYKEKTGGTVYQIDDTITLSDNSDQVYIIAKVPAGHWLIFDENGKGADYTNPAFYESEQETQRPSDPARFGYTFAGWYTGKPAEEGGDPTGSEFTFGSTLSATTKVYAKWTPVSTARYTVLIWRQNLAGNDYDYYQAVTVNNAQVNSTPAVSQQGTGDNAYARINGSDYQFTGFHLKEFDQGVTVVPEGTAVVNVYYDRTAYTFTFEANANGSFTYNRYLDAYEASSPRTTIYTVTRLYDQDITDIWEFTGSNGVHYPETNTNTSWRPTNSSTYTARITSMQRMPAENITFRLLHTNRTTRYFHYYIETVDGEQGTRTYSGRQYDLYKDLPNDFNVVYYNDDFWNLKGFERQAITKSNDQAVQLNAGQNIAWDSNSGTSLNGSYGGDNNHLYFYYTRVKYKLNYMDGVYVDADGVEQDVTKQPQLGEVELYYEADMSSYNKGEDNYFTPTHEGYTFAGWFYDEACVYEATFTEMPVDGLTVYAKWIKNQYRVFVHPNVPTSETNFASDDGNEGPEDDDAYGMGYQNTSFRVDYGDSISTFDAKREEYELVGWYTDEGLKNAFNFDAFVANDSNVTTPYIEKTEPTELDDWGNKTSDINKDKDNNRFWITRQLNLYAKWRSKMTGAKGIQVEYYAVETTEDGTHSGHFADNSDLFKDPVAYYNDNSESVGQGASSINDPDYEFKYWVLQTWDAEKEEYVDTDTTVLPGATFTVLKSMAKEETIGTQGVDDYYLAYTVRLRAHYGSIEAPTPTHITWYSNIKDVAGNELDKTKFAHPTDDYKDGKGWFVSDDPVDYNIGYNIKPANTYSYPGYTFLGWAKLSTDESPANRTLTENDLFLKWVDGQDSHFEAKNDKGEWVPVTQVAADENQPYDDLYAVWKGNYYVYYSGSGKVYAYDVNDTVNLQAHRTEGTLYGGYSTAYGGYTIKDADKEEARKAGENGYQIDTAENTTAIYNPDKTYVKGLTKWWNTMGTTAYGELTPKAGDVYYVKEVPNKYLTTRIQYIYDWSQDYKINQIYMMTVVDDKLYNEVFFNLEITATSKKTATLVGSFTFEQGNSTVKVTTKPKDFAGVNRGWIGYADGGFAVTEGFIAPNTEFKITPCWTTKDGVTVTGSARRFTTGKDGNKSTIHEVTE